MKNFKELIDHLLFMHYEMYAKYPEGASEQAHKERIPKGNGFLEAIIRATEFDGSLSKEEIDEMLGKYGHVYVPTVKEAIKTITVCDKCLQASCWQGLFYCEGYKVSGTIEKTIDELKELALEHPSYWKNI